MKWVLGTIALLVLGLLLQLSLLVYAMYVLLGILLLSRFFTRAWTEKIVVSRQVDGDVFEIGESTEVTVEVVSNGSVSVADQGSGVPDADRGHIFQRFWRRDRRRPGSAGLGLSIVARIAERHDATVSVGDRPGGAERHFCEPV